MYDFASFSDYAFAIRGDMKDMKWQLSWYAFYDAVVWFMSESQPYFVMRWHRQSNAAMQRANGTLQSRIYNDYPMLAHLEAMSRLSNKWRHLPPEQQSFLSPEMLSKTREV